MKIKLVVVLIIGLTQTWLHSTTQQNDKIVFKGQECELEVDWAYPSPLQAYYLNNKISYPFEPISTGNYRGHIATWEIIGNKLYLARLYTESPDENDPRIWNKTDIALDSVLPVEKIENGRVCADWFSGPILVLTDPIKEWFDSPYGKGKMYANEYKKRTIVQIEKGNILAETSFSKEEYWEIMDDYLNFQSHDRNELAVIGKYNEYINRFREHDFNDNENRVIYTERDFSLFLRRFITNEVLIPLTEYCIVSDAKIDLNGYGAFTKRDLAAEKGSNLLLLEMRASNVPKGSWERYSGGAVDIVIKLDCLAPMKQLLKKNFRFNNNFARFESPQFLSGEIAINNIENGLAIMSGNVLLTSEEPFTKQEINLKDNKIPIYSLEEYLKSKENSEY